MANSKRPGRQCRLSLRGATGGAAPRLGLAAGHRGLRVAAVGAWRCATPVRTATTRSTSASRTSPRTAARPPGGAGPAGGRHGRGAALEALFLIRSCWPSPRWNKLDELEARTGGEAVGVSASALATRRSGRAGSMTRSNRRNRLVARSLERVWVRSLRQVEAVEQALRSLARWQARPAGRDRSARRARPCWRPAPHVADRRGGGAQADVLRLVIRDVALDQKREHGTACRASLGRPGRRVSIGWAQGADLRGLRRHGPAGSAASGAEYGRQEGPRIAAILNEEQASCRRAVPRSASAPYTFCASNGAFEQSRSTAPTQPATWPDGSTRSRAAAAAHRHHRASGVRRLQKGRLQGRQLVEGQPWQISLTDDQISSNLQQQVRRTSRSK